ncbi:MAG: sugar O-acetyltransferase, partial [Duncaniella sp.]|nr:sugar O-acetyltransferase [Duncaniella sp.]
VVNDDVWIGQDCIFMPNVEIGSHSIIGARTVVTKSVPEGVVFAGNPGCIKKYRK